MAWACKLIIEKMSEQFDEWTQLEPHLQNFFNTKYQDLYDFVEKKINERVLSSPERRSGVKAPSPRYPMLDSKQKPPTVSKIQPYDDAGLTDTEKEFSASQNTQDPEPNVGAAANQSELTESIFKDNKLNNDAKHSNYFMKIFQSIMLMSLHTR